MDYSSGSGNSRVFKIDVFSSSLVDVYTSFQIIITGTIGMRTSTKQVMLDMRDGCLYATYGITAAVTDTYTYTLRDANTYIDFVNPLTSSLPDSFCGAFTYNLLQAWVTPISNTHFSFSTTTHRLSITLSSILPASCGV